MYDAKVLFCLMEGEVFQICDLTTGIVWTVFHVTIPIGASCS
jgi:hypothetical protein